MNFRCVAVLVMSAVCAGTACGPSTVVRPDSDAAQSQPVQRAEVQQRLARHLDNDPNAALCETLATEFAGGNHDALKPHFDTATFAERIIGHRSLPADIVVGLRSFHDQSEFFTKFMSPEGSKFLCLGTRTFLDHPHLVLRQWTQTRYDYLLLRLGDDEERPLTDYFIVSDGLYHSERQAYYFDPEIDSEKISGMLQMSYRSEFSEIIGQYQSLPELLQMTPYAFPHFINAVFTTEQTGTPLYDEAARRIELVFGERVYTVAYWRSIDARRRRDREAGEQYRGMLLELLDDYELLQ
jgi:hypothetical protein